MSKTSAIATPRGIIGRVLVIDDDPRDVFIIQRALKQAPGVTHVDVMHDGQAAVERLAAAVEGRADRPDLVLLDVQMPGLTGHGVLRARLENAGMRRIPVVMYSGSDDPTDVSRAFELGANSYVRKPLGLAATRAAVASVTGFFLQRSVLPSR